MYQNFSIYQSTSSQCSKIMLVLRFELLQLGRSLDTAMILIEVSM